jgi:hypothetical protein
MVLKWLACVSVLAAAAQRAQGEEFVLTSEARIRNGEPKTFRVQLPKVGAGQQVRLSMLTRVDWPGLAGFNPWSAVSVNGRELRNKDLVNKPSEFTCRTGVEGTWAKGPLWVLLYSQDFSDQAMTYPMPWGFPNVNPYFFVWDVTPYVRPGENSVTVNHVKLLAQDTWQVVKDLKIEIGAPAPNLNTTETVRPAPQGPLPLYVASASKSVGMDVSLSAGGAMTVSVGRRTLHFSTLTSDPDGKWTQTAATDRTKVTAGAAVRAGWKGHGYRVDREVRLHNDHVAVKDTLTNTSDSLVGVIYRNRMDLSKQGTPKRVLLCGKAPCSMVGADEPQNPSAMAFWDDLALGMFAEDDVYRVHVRSSADGSGMELADPRLGIDVGKSHVLEWSIYPVPGGDYWDVINAVRRNWGSNITIPGPGCFDAMLHKGKSQQEVDRFVAARKLSLVISDQTVYGDGAWSDRLVAEGTDIPNAKTWCDTAKLWVEKMHRASAHLRTLVYMHPAICTQKGADTLYADSKMLDSNGNHITTPATYPIYQYIPTLQNSYGKAYLKTFHWIMDEIRPDGIYMDEIVIGGVPPYVYRTAWDGCTVDIDQNTHRVAGKCSSSVLLMQPWKSELVRYLKDHGKMLVGNGPAHTRTMLQWQMPLFTETNSISFLRDMHLCTPWGLGNYVDDASDAACARMIRKALDHAGTILMYDWSREPQRFHFQHVMFPITPEELREGMVLGRERILTNRSGRYAWPDGSDADVYVFDGSGKLVSSPDVRRKPARGKTAIEIRMPGDSFAVLVKRGS